MADLDITEEELQEAQAFLDDLLETSRKEAISSIISSMRSEKSSSTLMLRYLELLHQDPGFEESITD
jgi:hypothetical protein